ncbi:MAG: MmgE/PrpD family protein [Mycobacterium sp.]
MTATTTPETAVAEQGPRWEPLIAFIGDLRWDELPPRVRNHAALVTADLMASALPGRDAPTSRIAAEAAADLYGGDDALSWFDGRRLSVPGAAFANAVMANSLDFDDGHRLTKGHPGAIIIPAAVAVGQRVGCSLTELMTAIVVGYEVGIRAGIVQHAHSPQYHSTGSWGAVGAAAAAAHLLRLSPEQTRHALGLAEYHGPISLIMRSVDDPQMTKDGIGWGAHVGVTSALLAQRGFTAVHPEFLTVGEFGTLRRTWAIEDVYVKPYPCCRWAQSAIAAALRVRGQIADGSLIEQVEIRTFLAAAALSDRRPTTTEEAQYNLIWPVAAALQHGRYDVVDVLSGFDDADVNAMADRTRVVVDPELTAAFPDVRRAEVIVTLADGTRIDSGLMEAFGEPGDTQWAAVIAAKLDRYLGKRLRDGDLEPPAVRLDAVDLDGLIAALVYAAG